MRTKSFLLGLGLGLLLSGIIFMIAYSISEMSSTASEEETTGEISKEEIEQRAKELGMIYYSELPETTTEQSESGENNSSLEPIDDNGEESIDFNSEREEMKNDITRETEDGDNGETENLEGSFKKVYIESGNNANRVCKALEDAKIIDSAAEFKQYLIDSNLTKKIKSGNFYLSYDMDYSEIATIITNKPKPVQ